MRWCRTSDRHSAEFAAGALVIVAAGGVMLFFLALLALPLIGIPFPQLAQTVAIPA